MVRVLSRLLLPFAAVLLAVSAQQQADLAQRSPLADVAAAAAAPGHVAKRALTHMHMHRHIVRRNESEPLHRPFASDAPGTAYAVPTATVAPNAKEAGDGDEGTDPDEVTTTTTTRAARPTIAYGLKSRVKTGADTYITLT